MGTSCLLGFVGDLMIDRDRPGEALEKVSGILGSVDMMFGNLEGAFSDDPHPAPSGGTPLFPGAANLDAFGPAGFDVLSMANNHIVDAGHAAMLENRARLHAMGVMTCGAGANFAEARTPAIFSADGFRIAVLAYASVFPMGYEARSNVPGLAPMRAYNLWRDGVDNYHVPGMPPRASTVPDETDLAHLREDIEMARQNADLVITSFHWGDFLRPYHLTDHELRTARWCVDAGADMVVGHHHHALRGMEWYHGKPILYGLGHFVFDVRLEMSEEMIKTFAATRTPDDFSIFPREGWPLLPLHADTRMTLLAWAKATRDGITDIGFLPCRLRPNGQVEPVDPDSDEGREVIAYIETCNRTQGLKTAIVAEDAISLAGHRSVRLVPVQ